MTAEGDVPSTVEHWIDVEPLEPEAFAPFGTVIEARGVGEEINAATCLAFRDLAIVELDRGARAAIHIYRPRPTRLPCRLWLLEHHPLGSQAFVPLGPARFLVVVAPPDATPSVSTVRAFLSDRTQGVQLRPGIWHHPLLALHGTDFVVVDRHCPSPEERRRNLVELGVTDWRAGVRAGAVDRLSTSPS